MRGDIRIAGWGFREETNGLFGTHDSGARARGNAYRRRAARAVLAHRDTLIHFPHARTLCLGSPFFRRNWSNYSFTPSVEGWIAILEKAAAVDVDTFLGGHGDVSTREDILEYAQMHSDFLAAVKAGIAEGKDRDELADSIKMQQYSRLRNDHRLRGWVHGVHHLLTTGKPMAAYP